MVKYFTDSVCGTLYRVPAQDDICLEGGLRLQGKVKSSIDMPLVSIITAVYNGGHTFLKTITSVLEQTYKNIEYIVIDGGSTDSTHYHILCHAQHIDYFISQKDDGLYSALNKGLSLARGKYILILNADDWYLPQTVSNLVEAINVHRTDIACALASIVDYEENTIGHIPDFPFDDYTYLRMPLRHELMLVPASLYNKVGNYDTSYRIISDLKFTQRLRSASVTCKVLQEELMLFRLGGLSGDIELLKNERQRLLIHNFPFLSSKDCSFLADMTPADCAHCTFLMGKYYQDKRFLSSLQSYMRFCAMALIK